MKSPNSEMFRLIRFAIRFRGWHSYGLTARKDLKRASDLGLLEVNWDTKQFRLTEPE